MAIKIVTGVLGAGKTYYCVSEILEKYFKYDNKIDEWIKVKDIEIVTNIDSFKLPVTSLDAEIKKAGGLIEYFSVAYHDKVLTPRQRIYIIDEAQGPKYFHRKFHNVDLFYFFQYSRHLGYDIYLITQDIYTLSKELQNLCEYEVKSARRSLSTGMEFRYELVANSFHLKWKVISKKKKVFMTYKSMDKKEIEKISSAPLRLAFMFGFSLLLLFLGVKFFLNFFFKDAVSNASTEKNPIVLSDQIKAKSQIISKPLIESSDSSISLDAVNEISQTDSVNYVSPSVDPFESIFNASVPRGYIAVFDNNNMIQKEIRIYTREVASARANEGTASEQVQRSEGSIPQSGTNVTVVR